MASTEQLPNKEYNGEVLPTTEQLTITDVNHDIRKGLIDLFKRHNPTAKFSLVSALSCVLRVANSETKKQ